MTTRRIVFFVVLAVAVTVGCGSPSPTSPTPAGAGAQITGAIAAAGASASMTLKSYRTLAAPVVPGLVVGVKGTGLKAAVDGGGRFTLRDVPAGDVELQFSGGGFDASLGVPGVQSSETIALSLNLTDTSVVVESSHRSVGSDVELEARIEALPPETLPLHFTAAATDVTTDGATTFTLGGAPAGFADLGLGHRVHVKGQSTATGLLARLVAIQNTNGDIQIPINGIVKSFAGTPDDFEFTIDGRLIMGDGTTEFFGNSVFDDLANDVRAEVKGQQRNGYVFALRIHVQTETLDEDQDDDQDESASIEGVLTSLGALPFPTLVVGGTTVTTNASTIVQRRGDTQDLGALAIGMTLHVIGDRQSDGSIVARRIQIKDDAPGSLLEVEGSVGGLKGTCPAVSFGVNGYGISTDAGTAYPTAGTSCAALKNGTKVKVKGIVQPDGTIKATSIET